MRTLYPVFFVLALGTAALMFQMSGFSSTLAANPTQGLGAPGQLQEQANNSALGGDQQKFDGQATQQNNGDLVGMIFNGGQAVFSLAGMVVMLPWELKDMGFPWWFAFSVGPVTQLLTSIGAIQFITGRVWR